MSGGDWIDRRATQAKDLSHSELIDEYVFLRTSMLGILACVILPLAALFLACSGKISYFLAIPVVVLSIVALYGYRRHLKRVARRLEMQELVVAVDDMRMVAKESNDYSILVCAHWPFRKCGAVSGLIFAVATVALWVLSV